jgi:hypothetical protein
VGFTTTTRRRYRPPYAPGGLGVLLRGRFATGILVDFLAVADRCFPAFGKGMEDAFDRGRSLSGDSERCLQVLSAFELGKGIFQFHAVIIRRCLTN